MELEFRRYERNSWLPDEGCLVAFLKEDNWDDYTFKTLYYITVFDEHGIKHEIGYIKIGYFGQKQGTKTEIPDNFNQLDQGFFSLGQGPDYYQRVQKLSNQLKKLLLNGLNDIVQNETLLNDCLNERVTKNSLLRGISVSSIKGQFRRILQGGALLTKFYFKYASRDSKNYSGIDIEFRVDPESRPPSNIHVLIGRNGVGKTHLLNNMTRSLIDSPRKSVTVGEFSNLDEETLENLFSSVVSVSFSAFDPFVPYPEKKSKSDDIRYYYVGLKRRSTRTSNRVTLMSHDMLADDLVDSMAICFSLGKMETWLNAIRTLESDPIFKESGLSDLISTSKRKNFEKKAKSIFEKMSSGHEIVLLTMTKLVQTVEERTLVLLDEPESHLHPPLLSAFIRALSDLLAYRNGVAIIATHSPVVLQEVPRSCVWKLRRTGMQLNTERPVIETFGENVGILTREIFGLEVTESGYHQLLKEALSVENVFERAEQYFDFELGSEAKGILRGLIANPDLEDE